MVAVALLVGVLDDYQIDRLTTFLDPAADPLGSGYNTRMARLAIAGGGLIGQGLFHGAQTQGRLVPYQQTDFVFSVAGEELGLLGAGLVIILVGIVLARDPNRDSGTDLFGQWWPPALWSGSRCSHSRTSEWWGSCR
jgi:rod shape determining protein RodA